MLHLQFILQVTQNKHCFTFRKSIIILKNSIQKSHCYYHYNWNTVGIVDENMLLPFFILFFSFINLFTDIMKSFVMIRLSIEGSVDVRERIIIVLVLKNDLKDIC